MFLTPNHVIIHWTIGSLSNFQGNNNVTLQPKRVPDNEDGKQGPR
jgi:hypothetical protein